MVRHGLEQATLTAVIAGAYLVSFIFVDSVLTPIQSYLMPTTLYGSIAFLPHGVRVLAVALYRWSAAPGILIGSLLTAAYYSGGIDPLDFTFAQAMLLGIGYFLGPMAALLLLQLGGIDTRLPIREPHAWRFVIVIAAISSVFTSCWTVLTLATTTTRVGLSTEVNQVIAFALGDTIGMVLLFALLLLGRRIWHASRDMNL